MNTARQSIWSTGNRFPGNTQQVFHRFFQADHREAATTENTGWVPRVDIREDERQFVILADIPGVNPAAIEISMDKGLLSIKGERQAVAVGDQAKSFSRVERASGSFQRSFALPDTVDVDGIVANGKQGVLEIVIPKKEREAPRRIIINSHN